METFSSAVTRRMKLVEYSTSPRVTVAVTFMLPGRMPWNSTG